MRKLGLSLALLQFAMAEETAVLDADPARPAKKGSEVEGVRREILPAPLRA